MIAATTAASRSTWDGGRNWRHLNNIAIGQFYEGRLRFPEALSRLRRFAGQLLLVRTQRQPADHRHRQRGLDHGAGRRRLHARIDPTDPNIVYAESQDGNLSRRDLRTSESKSIRPQEDSDTEPRYRFQWNSPLIISPHDPKTIYSGGNHLFKSHRSRRHLGAPRRGSDHRRRSATNMPIMGKVPKRGETLSLHDGVVAWPCITAIAESPVRAGVLWAGTDDGNLQVTRDDGKTWKNVACHIAGRAQGRLREPRRGVAQRRGHGLRDLRQPSRRRFPHLHLRIEELRRLVDQHHQRHSARSRHGARDPRGSRNPNLLFAGTEFGLFVTFNRGQNWERMKNGLPTVPVFDMQIHPRDHDLILATHGRSIWIMDDITALEEMAGNDSVLTTDLHLFTPKPGIEWKMANYRGFLGTGLFFAANPQAGVVLDYFAKTAGPVRVTVKDKAGNDVRQLTARAEAGVVNRIAWDMRSDAPDPPARAERPQAAEGPRWTRRRWRRWRGGAADAAPAAGANRPSQRRKAGGGGPGEPGAENPEGAAVRRAEAVVAAAAAASAATAARWSIPGEYTVALTVAGKTETKTVTVEDDPAPQRVAGRSHQTPHGHHQALHHDAPGRRRPSQDRRDEYRRDRADR